jgi:hypothetical protein
MGAIICDFGKNEQGLYLYRVNGDKKEIDKYIEELKDLGCEFYEPIELEKTWKCYSVLLKLKFPADVEEQMEKNRIELEERIAKTNAIRDRLNQKGLED